MKPSQQTHDTNTISLGTVPREIQRVPTPPTVAGTCPHARCQNTTTTTHRRGLTQTDSNTQIQLNDTQELTQLNNGWRETHETVHQTKAHEEYGSSEKAQGTNITGTLKTGRT
jgi:hypothetical protein